MMGPAVPWAEVRSDGSVLLGLSAAQQIADGEIHHARNRTLAAFVATDRTSIETQLRRHLRLRQAEPEADFPQLQTRQVVRILHH
jgi:hypothetical protein